MDVDVVSPEFALLLKNDLLFHGEGSSSLGTAFHQLSLQNDKENNTPVRDPGMMSASPMSGNSCRSVISQRTIKNYSLKRLILTPEMRRLSMKSSNARSDAAKQTPSFGREMTNSSTNMNPPVTPHLPPPTSSFVTLMQTETKRKCTPKSLLKDLNQQAVVKEPHRPS